MRKALLVLLAAAIAMSATAAGKQEPAANQPVKLTYWYWADNSEQSALQQSIVKAFNETNGKNITVTAEEYPWNSGGFTDSVFTAVMGGGGPDVSTFKLQAGRMFAANKLLADMSAAVAAWADKDQIAGGVWNMMKNATGDGTLSILPWTLEALYVYYRPSYFKMAGITKVPATFDEFLDAIAKTTMDTNKDGKTDIYGYGLRGAGGGHEHLGNFLYPYGATWADLTTPQAVQAYKAYLDIFKKRYAPEASVNWAFAEMTDGFQTGLVAMIIHHIGSNSRWQQAFKDDVDAFPVPGGPGGRYTVAGDTELVVYNKSKNKDAAFLFYRYMVTGEGGTTWFKKTGKGLGTQNVRSTPEFQNNRFQAVAAESLKFAGVLPPTDTLAAFANSVWANTNQQALLGKITPEEALAVMQRAIHGK